MTSYRSSFPIVPDDAPIVEAVPEMHLYDEEDLISNIQGNYQDKFGLAAQTKAPAAPFADQPSHVDHSVDLMREERQPIYSRRERLQPHQAPLARPAAPQKTSGQLAREQAREDLKRKRSASYLQDERPAAPVRKPLAPTPAAPQPSTVAPAAPTAKLVPDSPSNHLGHLAARLSQTQYILADLPAVYSLDKDECGQEPKVPKNTYDFLKRSQVYNYPERQREREHQIAQELDLTHIEEEVQ